MILIAPQTVLLTLPETASPLVEDTYKRSNPIL